MIKPAQKYVAAGLSLPFIDCFDLQSDIRLKF